MAWGWPPIGAGPIMTMSGKSSPVAPVSCKNHPSGTSNAMPNSALVYVPVSGISSGRGIAGGGPI